MEELNKMTPEEFEAFEKETALAEYETDNYSIDEFGED